MKCIYITSHTLLKPTQKMHCSAANCKTHNQIFKCVYIDDNYNKQKMKVDFHVSELYFWIASYNTFISGTSVLKLGIHINH